MSDVLPFGPDRPLRLAMLGMVDGNGHPYSWSAIFNGYDREKMAACPYAGIPAYLNLQPPDRLRIPNANVTHIWCEDPAVARDVAACSLIPAIVDRPEAVIGEVDAVIVATDIGHEHVARCRPFVEAGIPVFVDKPLVDNEADLRIFTGWVRAGKPLMSSSCMRYAKEYAPYHQATTELGELRCLSVTMAKSWESYGIHALEAMYPVLGPGFESVRNTGTIGRNVVHLTHRRGVDVTVVVCKDLYGAFGAMTIAGTAGYVQLGLKDMFGSFKRQLEGFVRYLRTGQRPFPFAETVELMKLVIAGIRSREQGGAAVDLASIDPGAGWEALR